MPETGLDYPPLGEKPAKEKDGVLKPIADFKGD